MPQFTHPITYWTRTIHEDNDVFADWTQNGDHYTVGVTNQSRTILHRIVKDAQERIANGTELEHFRYNARSPRRNARGEATGGDFIVLVLKPEFRREFEQEEYR